MQKYNMFMAQIGCATIGVLAFTILGPGWLAKSVGLSAYIAYMIYTGTIHPKEAYVVNNEEGKSSPSSVMPRDKYLKPLIFHDGRLAFLPTPLTTLGMFMWLPIGILLAIYR